MTAEKMTKEEYLALLEEIRKHDRAYFVDAKPIISDFDYDQLVKSVEAIEGAHSSWVSPSSPTRRVGETSTTGFSQVTHRVPMLSLANTYSEEELSDFVKRIHKWTGSDHVPLCAELKMDGVPVTFSAVWSWFCENALETDPHEFVPTIPGCDRLYVADGKLNFQDQLGTQYDFARSSLRRYYTRAMDRLAQNK